LIHSDAVASPRHTARIFCNHVVLLNLQIIDFQVFCCGILKRL
jgi:hypothetical protein